MTPFNLRSQVTQACAPRTAIPALNCQATAISHFNLSTQVETDAQLQLATHTSKHLTSPCCCIGQSTMSVQLPFASPSCQQKMQPCGHNRRRSGSIWPSLLSCPDNILRDRGRHTVEGGACATGRPKRAVMPGPKRRPEVTGRCCWWRHCNPLEIATKGVLLFSRPNHNEFRLHFFYFSFCVTSLSVW